MMLVDTTSWIEAMRRDGDPAVRARMAGTTVPRPDMAIAARVMEHGVQMEHDDAHLTALAALFD